MIQPQRIIECKKVIQIQGIYIKKFRSLKAPTLKCTKKPTWISTLNPPQLRKPNDSLPTGAWRQALTKHRNVLLEAKFSVEFGGFFWGGTVKKVVGSWGQAENPRTRCF